MSQFATPEEKLAYYKDAYFAGPEGQPLVVTEMAFAKNGKDRIQIVLKTEIGSKLKNGYTPDAGFENIETETVEILLTDKDDMQMTLDIMNKAYGFKVPLVDSPDWYYRFAEDGPDSVYKEIVGKQKRLYVRASPRQKGDSVTVYWNIHSPVEKKALTLANLKAAKTPF